MSQRFPAVPFAIMFFILVALIVISIGAVIWAIVDSVSRSNDDFASIGSSKTRWILLIVLGSFFGGFVGLASAIVYLLAIRPRMLRRKVSTDGD